MRKLGKWQRLALWCIVQNGGRYTVGASHLVGGSMYIQHGNARVSSWHSPILYAKHQHMINGLFKTRVLLPDRTINPDYLDQAVNFYQIKAQQP